MGFRIACCGLALLGLSVAASSAHAAQTRSSTERPATSRQASPDPALRALYPRAEDLHWSGSGKAEARRALALLLLERERRLDPSLDFDVRSIALGFDSPDLAGLSRADRSLSRAWIGYLARRRGTVDGVDAGQIARVMSVLEAAETPGGELAAAALELAIVEALGGWRPVEARPEPESESPLLEAASLGEEPPIVRRRLVADRSQLERRLVQSFDLPARYLSVKAPEPVIDQAIRRFQRRHGLAPDGVAGARTLAMLREPVAAQLARVRVNLARSDELESRASLRRYVEVNIPAFELRVVENGQVTLRSRVIVGADKTPTPVFDDVIRFIDLDPAWYVPPSITREVLDRNIREPGYLERAGFVWRATEGGRPQLIQRPGPENALGRFKFVFPNHHAVYLHDTAQRGLFGRPEQALSHGCVRVERPAELALALLAEQGWTAARLEQALATRRTRRIELVDPVPVFLDYRTADIDADGRLRLLGDLYGHDRAARTTFAGKRLLSAARPAATDQVRRAEDRPIAATLAPTVLD